VEETGGQWRRRGILFQIEPGLIEGVEAFELPFQCAQVAHDVASAGSLKAPAGLIGRAGLPNAMECPRCNGDLKRYALFDREAFTCEECGYLGVPVDHEPTPQSVESWSEALERFREKE
jgi:hypothetical protein